MKQIFFTFYLLLLVLLVGLPLGIKPLVKTLFQDEMVATERELAKGTFFMVARELAGRSRAEQEQVLAEFQPGFGYPLALYPLGGVSIRSEDELDFMGGVIVWDTDRERLLLRLGNTRRVLAMGGPFPGRGLITRAGLYFWAFCLIGLILPALFWTWRIRRDVRHLDEKTAQFFGGDLTARARVSAWSSMRGVVHTVNTLANKAQKLIGYQKSLANAVSHEIRTPLARIKFSLEMMPDTDTPGSTDFKAEIGRDVEEIEGLVDEMLTYARFEREQFSPQALSENDIISWIGNLIAREGKDPSGIGLDLSIPQGVDRLSIAFEPTYLGWALRNLIRNGLRHARTRVVVSLAQAEDGILIQVVDDGPGIPEKVRDKIFIPFFRVDGSRNRESGGYGLGLAIAARIVVWHGGRFLFPKPPAAGPALPFPCPERRAGPLPWTLPCGGRGI